MARGPRINLNKIVYHVTSRGNNKQNIFLSESDYLKCLNNLKKIKKEFPFKLFAFVLMKNHLHLVLETVKTPISKIMQILQTSYSMYFNRKYQRSGHVFQGRFKSIIVDKDEYLLQVIRYVHLNPVKVGLCLNPEDYPFSSYSFYLQEEKESMLDRDEILPLFFEDKKRQLPFFKSFTQAGISKEVKLFERARRGILGRGTFVKRLETKLAKRLSLER